MNNANAIAVIICSADEFRLQECLFYLNRLIIPDGYSVELICVTEAESMAAGYQEGMISSGARYKIYLHEDVHILNTNLFTDLISIFETDDQIGMIGMVGITQLPSDGCALSSWNTGKLYQNQIPRIFHGTEEPSRAYTEVEALDGLFLATSQDISWRRDLFNGWDYYDLSQCLEFRKKDLKCVVPFQDLPWCYHDNSYSRLSEFHKYREIFLTEYAEFMTGSEFSAQHDYARELEMETLKEQVRALLTGLLEEGRMEEVSGIFAQPEYRGWLCLQEHELLAGIYQEERKIYGTEQFPFAGNSFPIQQQQLWQLRWLLKRLEFKVSDAVGKEELQNSYSQAAISLTAKAYSICPSEVMKMMEESGKGQV